VGIAVVAMALAFARVHGGGGRLLGTDVTFSSAPTGVLSVSPIGPFVEGLDLKPGGSARQPATGTTRVRNQSGRTFALHMDVQPSLADLDRVLWVKVTADGNPIFTGWLGDLRNWSHDSVTLAPGQSTVLSVVATIPPSVHDGYQNRILDVALGFHPRRVEG
jgi:hypothetical protein